MPATRGLEIAVDTEPASIRIPLSRAQLERLVAYVLRSEGVHRAFLSIALVDRRGIARLNRTYLGRRGATDVIAFSLQSPSEQPRVVGDVYIAPDVVRANARERGVPVREELARVLVHGVLHVLGYDHPEGVGREDSSMWRRQEELLAEFSRWSTGR
jgi:probable rRNA maturation factor